MLVLARRPSETIVFPNVGITLKVVRVKGQVVRIGVEAPADVAILRGELSPVEVRANQPAESSQGSAEWMHQLRNRLNHTLLTVEVMHHLIRESRFDEVKEKFFDLITDLQSLDETLEPEVTSRDSGNHCSDVRVLVVDDQENERTLLANLLQLNGCRVDTVGDGLEAMEYLETHTRPDIILLDMSMPRCNGAQFLENLRCREEYRDLRVFAVSGHSSQSAGVPVGPEGVDGWFRKPLNTNRLLSSMGQVIQA